MDDTILLSILIFAAGLLYSSVGHGGASGYLAAMALFGLAPEEMKPAALVLNILVALITTFQFYRAGSFSWVIFLPFAITSIPFAFIGGSLSLPGSVYKPVAGLVLLYAAYRLLRRRQSVFMEGTVALPIFSALIYGAVIGLLSGAIGVGGGIFLSPLLLCKGWAEPKQTAGISAMFILVNSIAGIAGHLSSVKFLPDAVYLWAIAAVLGGMIGSSLGSRRFENETLYLLLAVVLVIAGAKLMFV